MKIQFATAKHLLAEIPALAQDFCFQCPDVAWEN